MAAKIVKASFLYWVLAFAAGWVFGPLPPWMGFGALSLLCAAEVAGIWWVRGLSMASYLATFTLVSATMSLLMLGLFAIMPILITRVR